MASPEIERIQAEYRRRSREIPENFYSEKTPGNRYITEGRNAKAIALLAQVWKSLEGKDVLEIGCGQGAWYLPLSRLGLDAKHYHGIDLSEERLARARVAFPEADLYLGDASRLPWPDKCFDLIVQSTLFTSVLEKKLKEKIAMEMMRVVKKDGAVLWYDFRYDNPWNANVKGIEKKEIKNLFKRSSCVFQTLTLIPPLARALAPISFSFCRMLETIPVLKSHYLVLIRPGACS